MLDVALVRKTKIMALDGRGKKDEWLGEEELLKWWHIRVLRCSRLCFTIDCEADRWTHV